MSVLRTIIVKIPLFFKVVSLYMFGGAIFLGVWQLIPHESATVPVASIQTAQATVIPSVKQSTSGEPVRLTVTRLGIDLVIKDGTYNKATGEWTLSDDAVYFATMTKQPNDASGNTFIYGHNTEAVLAPLRSLIPGDIVTLATSNGHVFSYSYTHDTVVLPSLTSVFRDNPEKPRLTVMTCDGIWSQGRRLMYFDFKEVS